MGCCEMVGDYCDDSSVKENLNLLLRLARVETNVDSKVTKEQGSLKDFFKGRMCWGLPQRPLATIGCIRGFKEFMQGAHTQE